MKNEKLPQGDLIRQLLIKSNITTASINQLMKEKGVFIGHNEKNNSVPMLMKSIVSPRDFDFLYESQKIKEETIKYRTSSIKCASDFEFPDILQGEIDLHSLVSNIYTYKPNYKIIGNPSFYYEDNDTAVFEFELERENLLNDFYTSKTYHRGSIVLKKTSDNDIQISIQQNSTSKETLEVNNIIMSEIKEKLHNKSIIKSNDDIITVQFNHFSNSSRILFFYSFVKDFNIYTEFISITDIDLYLDENVKSHNDIRVFLEELDNLKLNGKGLQNHVLLTKSEYFPKLIFGAIKLRYKINYMGVEGFAIINLGFPDYVKNKVVKSEFQISIDLILDKKNRNTKTENSIRKKLLELFEQKKVESYAINKIS